MNLVIPILHSSILGVPLYPLFFLGACAGGIYASWVLTQKWPEFRNVRYFDACVSIWVLGILGAKGAAILLSPIPFKSYLDPFKLIYLFEGGYQLLGGTVAAIIALCILSYIWRSEISFWRLCHLVMLVGLPMFALGRLGCLFAGCCFGLQAADGATGLHVMYGESYGVLSQGPRIAVQLYDSIGVATLSLLLWTRCPPVNRSVFRVVGGRIALVLGIFGAGRWIEDGFRDPYSRMELKWAGMYFSQWIALSLAVLGIIVGMVWLRQSFKKG